MLCHSYGKCYGNYPDTQRSFPNDIPNSDSRDAVISIYTQYQFVLAMENKCVPGYITEKIIAAFYSGAIPIYWGSSNSSDLFNPKAFINVNDFSTLDECVEYVLQLTDTQKQDMLQEPIYISELGNICNNSNTQNSIWIQYQELFKNFLVR